MALAVVVLTAVPVWIWATLIMAAFAALTVFTMWLARIPTQRPTPGSPPDSRPKDGDVEETKTDARVDGGDA